ncbi:helix-turn-helix domain-containing protein [Bacillus smithii]|uniref:helix-turn-helix domain-containing protein n=1 Tax=Bacillus smithii TaxID=1479 RepID=UPI0030C9098A
MANQLKDTLRVFVVPTEILDMEELTIYEKMVYVVLRSYANSQDDTAFPSYETIAKKASMSKRKAIDCVEKLVKLGLLIKEERKKVSKNGKISPTSNLYTIRRPAEVKQGVVNDMHHPSVPDAPPLVNDMHHPSAPDAPENKNNKITNTKILKENNRERDLIKGAEIEEELKEYIEDRLEEFEKKGINLQTVINWVEANTEFYNYTEFAVGINQLLEFPEPIKNPIRFLNSTFVDIEKYVKDFRKKQMKKGKKEMAAKKKQQPQPQFQPQPQAVFFNWLER